MNTYTSYPISAFITHLVYLRGGEVEVDVEKITVCIYITNSTSYSC